MPSDETATPHHQGRHQERHQGHCPICGRESVASFRPFCSKRCADVDLGRWLGGRYAIPGDPAPTGGSDNSD